MGGTKEDILKGIYWRASYDALNNRTPMYPDSSCPIYKDTYLRAGGNPDNLPGHKPLKLIEPLKLVDPLPKPISPQDSFTKNYLKKDKDLIYPYTLKKY